MRAMTSLDRNAAINLSLFAATLAAAVLVHPLLLLLPLVFHATNDFLQWRFGVNVFDTDVLVRRCYQALHDLNDIQRGKGIDLEFNFYDGDLSKSSEQAQLDKWNFMWEQLALAPGSRLVDVGCGYGNWLRYARDRGVDVVGINFTREQAAYVANTHNIEVFVINWKDVSADPALQDRLYGRFDAVTFMGSVEHFVPPAARNCADMQSKIYSEMFEFAYRLLDPSSPSPRMLISCLHQVDKRWDLRRVFSCYILNRTMCGFYPVGDEGLTRNGEPYFAELCRHDKTEDYRITGVLEEDSFQNPHIQLTKRKMLKGIAWLAQDPYFLHRLVSVATDCWMAFFGDDAYAKEFDPGKRRELSYVRLWMILFEKRSDLLVGASPR